MDNTRLDNSTPDTITDRAMVDRAEEISLIHRALQVSEARYRRLFEAAQDGVLLLNAGTAQIECESISGQLVGRKSEAPSSALWR